MAVQKVFDMKNHYSQYNSGWKTTNGAQAICTAASLAWVRACLKGVRVTEFNHIGVSFHNLNIQMATIRKLDSQPAEQSGVAQLALVEERSGNLDAVTEAAKKHPNDGVIFWTNGHTMGYRYAHLRKEFFDIEDGLYWAKYTKDIKKKIDESYGGQVVGYRVVRLP